MNHEFSKQEEKYIVDFLRERNIERINKTGKDIKITNGLYIRYVKRVLDIFISLIAIPILLPVYVIVAMGVYFFLGSPIVFKQYRTGKDGLPFLLYKFRSMKDRLDEHGKELSTGERLNSFGIFLRKSSLDEILNFFNILKGDMSVIGPRPLLYENNRIYSKRHMMRHAVRPGLECPRLLERDEYKTDYQYQLESDIWYIENCCFSLDCKLLFKLFQMAFEKDKRKKNAEIVAAFAGYDDDGNAINLSEAVERYPELKKMISGV